MRRKTVLIAIALTLGGTMLASGAMTAVADEHADVSVAQNADGAVAVTVTQNDSAVTNSTVEVTAVENTSYEGGGEYATDENGTVDLPAPEENATVAVTATVDGETVTTEAELEAGTADKEDGDSFGRLVSSFVASLLDENETSENETTANETDRPFGQLVSSFVLDNNPAADKVPGHAGPGNDSEAGLPEDAGSENKSDAGPPEDAGPDGDAGPPEDVGPGGDDGNDDQADDGDEKDDDGETDGNGGQGPPDSAGPP